MYYLQNCKSNSYNTKGTEFLHSTNVLTGKVLQYRGKLYLLPKLPHFVTVKQKYSKYENMIS